MKYYLYENLEKHFTKPKIVSPFFKKDIKIPRKLKKKVKSFYGIHWYGLTNAQRLWYYMEYSNPNYKRYILKIL